MNRILIGATALALAVPAMAQMQAPAAPQAPNLAQRVQMTQTRDQAVAKVREQFTRMDANRDGFVAGDEMQSMRGQNRGERQMGERQMGERRGRGGDRMAMRDGPRDPAAAFDRLDANRDGSLSREEFGRAREIREERRIVINGAPGTAMQGERGGKRLGAKRMGAKGMGGRMAGGMMRMADLDRDGRVSLQEATTSALQRFDRVDANRDGRITPDERKQQREQRKAMRGNRAG